MAKKMGKTKGLSKRNVQDVPNQSGVYNLKNQNGEIIYTGSAGAGRLKARLEEHLSSGHVKGARKFQTRPLSPITYHLLPIAYSMDDIVHNVKLNH